MTSQDSSGGLGDLLAQMQSLQSQLVTAQAEAGAQEVEGEAGGGVVRVRATGELAFTGVSIDPTAIDPADVGLLEDLMLAALRDLAGKIEQLRRQAMGAAMSGALGGLFGGAGEDDEPVELPPEPSSGDGGSGPGALGPVGG
ncbi:MAG: hypothetical protein JWM85_1507 [Acidimicrobiaceae bacterium]|nr:hypothetical protein [Acidimicrobiaceae bacterium]